MLPSTQEILISVGGDAPAASTWGSLRDQFDADGTWLDEVEAALLDRQVWEASGRPGPGGIVRLEVTERWKT